MTPRPDVSPVFKVNGQPMAAEDLNRLIGVRVQLAVGVVGRATLRFSDPGYTISQSSAYRMGSEVSILAPDGSTPLMVGVVTGVSLERDGTGQPELTVVLDDAAYRLTRGTRVGTYVKMTGRDVLSDIASKAGLRISASGLPPKVHDYLLQAGSDLAFFSTVVARSGCVWYVDGTGTIKVVAAHKAQTSVTLSSDDLTSFGVRATGHTPTGVTVTGWDRETQQEIVGTSSAPPMNAPTFAEPYLRSGSALSSAVVSAADQHASDSAEAECLATALHHEWRTGAITAEGTCYLRADILPMTAVTVDAAGPVSGTYLVSEVEHVYAGDGFVTRFVAGPQRRAGLVDVLGVDATDAGFTANGLVVGHVTDVNDPDKYGRVKVTYNGIDGKVESDWARIVTLGAGKERGITFQPEVSDEVILGFERGDTRRPIVLGGLFSKRSPTAVIGVEQSKVVHRRLTSRLGHVVELADGEGPSDQHILLKLGKPGHRLRLGADRFDLELEAGKPLTIAAGSSSIAFDDKGNITIKGVNITIEAQAKLSVSATEGKVEAKGPLSVEGVQVNVKASTTATLEGTIVNVKGTASVAIN